VLCLCTHPETLSLFPPHYSTSRPPPAPYLSPADNIHLLKPHNVSNYNTDTSSSDCLPVVYPPHEQGWRHGYCFKRGDDGLGYYLDCASGVDQTGSVPAAATLSGAAPSSQSPGLKP